MAIQLELTPSEARLLAQHLDQHLKRLDSDLVRTDKFDLQHALAREIAELRSVVQRIERCTIAAASSAYATPT